MMTRAQYAAALGERAKLMSTNKTSQAVVIERWNGSHETAEWSAWVKYWTAIEARATLMLIEGRTTWTVPTQYPWEFDVGYNG